MRGDQRQFQKTRLSLKNMTILRESDTSISAWEKAAGLGALVKALLPMCAAVLFRPVYFFKQLMLIRPEDLKKRTQAAVAFAIVMGYLKLLLEVLNAYWLRFFSGNPFSPSAGAEISLWPTFFLDSPLVLLRPLLSLIVTLGLVFFGVKLILGFEKKFFPVLLVVCYQSASEIFFLIPLVGGLLATVWAVALILVGVREVYSVNMGRSFLAAIVLPIVFLLSILLALGPSLGKTLISFYPEARTQITKLNDLNAYTSMSALVLAAEAYKKDLGFYPAHLGVLNKYLSNQVFADATTSRSFSGYTYSYTHTDDQHFKIYAQPQLSSFAGNYVFYADDSDKIRFNGPDGPEIKSITDIEQKIFKKQ